MAKKVAYLQLKEALSKLDAQISAAETHGLLVGLLCLSPAMQESVLREILIENLDCRQPTKTEWKIFTKLCTEISTDLIKKSFMFKPLLPDDDAALEERLAALGNWCRGYLSGLGLVGISGEDLKNVVVRELISDLSQIAHVDMTTDESDEDEHNYTELVEYVRIAVQNVQAELHAVEQQQILH
jgi:uncharacterized protein YgfB (UPF0149 family)